MSQNTLTIGEEVPNFTLKNPLGKEVSLSDFRGKMVVLYFYPKDHTPGCTKEACLFRDSYEDFQEVGAEVIGISSDSEKSHQGFQEKHELPFILLTDKGGKVRKLFGIKKTLGFIPGRETFIINKKGVLLHRFNSLTNVHQHIEEALTFLKKS